MSVVIVLICIGVASAEFADDIQTYEPECLGEGAFFCLSGGCIPQEQYCDGRSDCPDSSDENFCTAHKPNELACNETHQFMCNDKLRCIPNVWICNNDTDCEDGSDEAGCTSDPVSNGTCKGFVCDGKSCISNLWKCDGTYDCQDMTDEDVETCRHSTRTNDVIRSWDCTFSISNRTYPCLDGSFCLTQDEMCDGLKDCKDGSDEGPFCANWKTMCANFTCKGEAKCTPQRTGPACICLFAQNTEQYNYTSHECEDVNDCLLARPQCSHMCHNRKGSFWCSCDEGYKMDSAKYLCYASGPEAMLFFSTKNDIRYVKVKSKQQFVVANGIKQAHGVSYDGTYVYWVETAQGHQSIVRAKIDDAYDSNQKQVLVSLGLEEPGDIAIDWLGDNIFFSDAERGIISVCRTNGAYCATVGAATKHPRFVTLDARNGNMYWADWRNKPVLMQAKMDGTQSDVLVDHLYTFASGLAMDAPGGRLYFVDRTIKVVKVDDGQVYSLFEEPFHHPYSIAVFESTVFWSDWTSNTVQTTDKIHSTTVFRSTMLTLDVPVFDMHIYHPLLMNRKVNPCEKAGCSHFCFVTSNSTFSCGCPEGMELKGRICQTEADYRPQYLIIGGGSSFSRWQYNSLGNPETHATTFTTGKVRAMAYDNLRDKLYIFDGSRECIQYIDMRDFHTGITHLFMYEKLHSVVDMDYDYVTDALYIVDAGRRLIEAVSLKTKDRAIIYVFNEDEMPISFCVVPEYGKMLVAVKERDSYEIYIDSIGLDGSDRKHILMTNLRGPHVILRYSPHADVVYISDEEQGTIDFVHPEGTGRENFRELSTTVASLAVTDTQVFWADKRTARIFWSDVHEVSHKIRRIQLSIFPNDTHLYLLATSPPPDPKNPLLQHRCHTQPSPCPELCVQVPHDHPQNKLDMGYKCLCSPGRAYSELVGRCIQLPTCRADEIFCHKSYGCVATSKKCDGHKDCYYGEDEEACEVPNLSRTPVCDIGQKSCDGVCVDNSKNCPPEELITCNSHQFRCVNDSICIERSLVCDGRYDCVDGSDEMPGACDTLSCFETEFQCANGPCIPITWHCDSSDDCVDGSDEIDCVNKTCGFGYYKCRSGECVEQLKHCDHKFDCTDHSDEEDCDHPDILDTLEVTPSCRPSEYVCENNASICLPQTARCNGKIDCPGATDEDGCNLLCAPYDTFPCKQEHRCVRKKQVCNGKIDCHDGSDETPEACATVNKTSRLYAPHAPGDCHNGFSCRSGQCVEWAAVCDGTGDCFDESDEGGHCSTPCTEHTCSHACHRTPSGPQCSCPQGYSLHTDDYSCVDIDECKADVCSQICRNTPGSYVCSCHLGYERRPSDRRSCKALRGNMSVLFVSGNSVKSMYADYSVYLEYNDPTIARISDLDYNVRKNQLYVASAETGKLIEVNRTEDDLGFNVITNVGRPTRVAVDWITDNVYFVDSKPGSSCIRVCSVKRKRCAKLQKLQSDAEVSALVVDPASRKMFYCVRRSQEAVVQSATLGGRQVSELATLANCTGLAVDSFKRRLYAAETGPSRILQMDFDGNILKSMYTNDPNLQAPHDLAIFEDSIYFLGANSFKLSRCHLHGWRTCEPYLYSVFNANSFVIRHESVQRDDVVNECDGVTCSNVCVLAEDGPKCVCDEGGWSRDGSCPHVARAELAMFNGWTRKDEDQASSVSFTFVGVILVLFVIYLAVFAYYQLLKRRKNRAMDYMQVRYHNTPEGITQLNSPIIEMPNAGGITHEFVNPLQFVRNIWQQSFMKKSRPHGTAGLVFNVQSQQDLSDTESDLDVRENRRMLRN